MSFKSRITSISKLFFPNSIRSKRLLPIFDHPAFKRNSFSHREQQEALTELRAQLASNNFGKLKKVPQGMGCVRLFKFNNMRFAVKNTGPSKDNGFVEAGQNNPVREFLHQHHKYYRQSKLLNKSSYILRTPRIIAWIGKYLVMDYIQRWEPSTKQEMTAFRKARNEVEQSIQEVSRRTGLAKIQCSDFIPAGMYHGKVVFYAVYDYT
ncbi:MAG: hypothetical protein NTY48_07365 [Candidatus Diapherotrites archaeon]|nr:hypothetical protein [Candidatus Diapherotrites archaeon]